jgi:hypothetical protein
LMTILSSNGVSEIDTVDLLFLIRESIISARKRRREADGTLHGCSLALQVMVARN